MQVCNRRFCRHGESGTIPSGVIEKYTFGDKALSNPISLNRTPNRAYCGNKTFEKEKIYPFYLVFMFIYYITLL